MADHEHPDDDHDDGVVWDDRLGCWRDEPTGQVWDDHAARWVAPDDLPAAVGARSTVTTVGAARSDGRSERTGADPVATAPATDHDHDHLASDTDDDRWEPGKGDRASGVRRTLSLLALLVVVGALIGLGGAAAMTFGLVGGDADTEPLAAGEVVRFEVPEGVGASTVADLLEEEGVITSALAFRVSARFDDRSSQIQPGVYELTAGMDAGEILEIITQGPVGPETFRVTVPEGLTVDQTLERLGDASAWDAQDFRAALDAMPLPAIVPVDELPDDAEPWEGLLFPETYEFVIDATPEDILTRLVDQTEAVLAAVEPHGELTLYQTLVAASLIEREARLAEEQRTISSVIHNRIERDMLLQIDATVIYAHGEHLTRVLFEHLEIDSPWNTYRSDGLPPTPISGSGAGAITAAADPEDTDYLYYVVIEPETGRHGFSETLEEHEARIREVRG